MFIDVSFILLKTVKGGTCKDIVIWPAVRCKKKWLQLSYLLKEVTFIFALKSESAKST